MRTSIRFQIVVFVLMRTVINIVHRMVYPFLRTFAIGLGVDIQSLSYVVTGRSVISMFGALLGTMGDRIGRKKTMVVGVLMYIVGLTMVVFWPTYPVFFAAMIIDAIGKYLFDPAMQAYLGDRIPYRQRGLAIAVTETSWSLSFIVGIPAIAFIMARWGWLSPFAILAVFGVIFLLMLLWMVPGDADQVDRTRSVFQHVRDIFTHRPAVAALGVGVLITTANEIINLVFGVWLEDRFGLQLIALGSASAVIGFSELGGEGLVAVLVDRIGKIRAIRYGILFNILASFLLVVLGRSVTGALVGLFLFYLSFEFTLVSTIPLMTEIVPTSRASLMAFNVAGLSLGRALGSFISPWLYGLGLLVSAGGAIVFNLLGLAALRGVLMDETIGVEGEIE